MEKYRFDDAYSLVSVYDDEAECYLHAGTYFTYDINAKMSDAEKTAIVSHANRHID